MVCGTGVGMAHMSEEKKETSLAGILIGAAALGVALVFLAVYSLSGYITRHMSRDVPHLTPQRDELPIQRVFASGLYPAARPVDDTRAWIDFTLPASGTFQVVTAEFETQDKLDDVAAYYRKQFAGEAEERKEPDGIRWTFKDHSRVILVKEVEGRPHIRLVWRGEDQP
jgi:hypothetical protein